MDSTAVALKSASYSFFSKLPNLNPNPNRLSPSNFTTFVLKPIIKSIQTPNSDHLNPPSPSPLKSNRKTPNSLTSSFSCSAVTSPPSPVSDLAATKLHRLTAEFQSLSEPIDRVKRLLHYATLLPPSDESLKVISNRVMGCTAQVWLDAKLDNHGRMIFKADSDSEISRGFCSCLVWILDGAAPEEVLSMKTDDLAVLSVASNLQNSRVNTWHNVLISMQKRTKALVAERERKPLGEPFPSLIVTAEGIHAKGSYAEAQMNSLTSLLKVCKNLRNDKDNLSSAYEAGRFSLCAPNGKLIADVGCEPILHTRDTSRSRLDFALGGYQKTTREARQSDHSSFKL